MNHLALAIDFGSSRTKVAWRDEQGIVRLLKFGDLDYLPSLFYLPEGSEEILLGHEAQQAYEDEPLGVVEVLKRLIERGKPIYTSESRSSDPQPLLEALFRNIKHQALQSIPDFQGLSPDHIVITVPGNAPEGLELKLRRAANAVAWDSPQILAEPVAAARYWLHGEGSDAGDAVVVVLDCGGGTTDWACLQRTDQRIHRAERYKPDAISIGGSDLDQALSDWVAQTQPELYAARPEPRLRDQLRAWKEAMFNGEQPSPIRIKGQALALDRVTLERLYSETLIAKVLPPFQRFLEPITREHPQTQVLIVGGSATELMEQAVQTLHDKVKRCDDPLGAVILGALALPGSRVSGQSASSTANQQPAIASPVLPPVSDIHGWSTEQVQTLQRQTAEALNRSIIYSDSLQSGSNGPEMVIIPVGSFVMGSQPNEPERRDQEGPQHRVTLARPFAIGRYAVTFYEYDLFCQHTQRSKPGDEGWGRGYRPVINVSWGDALAYCEWLNRQTGGGYRLPSEAEWEYACRAGTTRAFFWGDTITPQQVNYDGNYTYNFGVTGEYRKKTLPVGEFTPNPWGLYQMHGNVLEWCQDGWHEDYMGAPDDGSVWANTGSDARVLRGGSWYFGPDGLRSAYRSGQSAGDRDCGIGFRLVQDISL